MIQRSLVLMKPDALQRGLVGEILHRFERKGLKIIGMKLFQPDAELVKKHYKTTDENLAVMGNKTIEDCVANGIELIENVGTDDPVEIGRKIWNWNVEFLTSGPVIAIVFEGPNAVANIRKVVGHTLPALADAGTIRGDFSVETAVGSNIRQRAIYNLVHASGNTDEAEFEITLWFKQDELYTYKRIHDSLYSY